MDESDRGDEADDEILAQCIEVLRVLSFPRALEERERSAARGDVQRETSARIADLLVFDDLRGHALDDDDPQDEALDERLARARPLLERVQAMVQSWRYGAPPDAVLVECAQAALAALAPPGLIQ